MDNLEANEEAAFVVEDVTQIVKEAIDSVLANVTYQHTKVPQWTSLVIEGCLKRLKDLNKPFKYIVTSVVMQRNGTQRVLH